MAEGARFLLTSLDVNFDSLIGTEKETNICSFDYFRLVKPHHEDYSKLWAYTSQGGPCQ